jgi:hypothetical protein
VKTSPEIKNMTYQSYTSYQPDYLPESVRNTGPQIRNHDSVTRTTTVDGVMTEMSIGHDKGTTAELNPYHNTDSFGATARNADGSPVTELLPTTLVTIDGVQAPVQFWVTEGKLAKGSDGLYAAAAPTVEAPEAVHGDHLPIAPAVMDQINQALDSVEQGNLDMLAATAVGVSVGRLDQTALAHRFSEVSGHGGEEGAARLAVLQGAYQAQADTALTTRFGVGADDLGAFYQWARENRQGQLQEAVHHQLSRHDVSGYKALAEQWFAANPPSLNALKAHGYLVRTQGRGTEVYVRGSWMSPGAAARAGLI